MGRALVILRRDLRIQDNTALNAALTAHDAVHVAFILDPRQTAPHEYHSSNAFAFMLESLRELHEEIRDSGGVLNLYTGYPHELIPTLPIDAVYLNHDYTPFSRMRDALLKESCEHAGIAYHAYHDALLIDDPATIRGASGPYKVYTPFLRTSRTRDVRAIQERIGTISPEPIGSDIRLLDSYPVSKNPHRQSGGRRCALTLLSTLDDIDYDHERDIPSSRTSRLSPHLKFGTISIREAYWKAADTYGIESTYIKELYWRDFYAYLAYHNPHVFERDFTDTYTRVEWLTDDAKLDAWKIGMTGFPIVDAGMRQLLTTGYMHNRVRMIVASFLTKDLHIHWREGEKHFAKHLTDYDPASNNGGWQWAASTGADAQPYFRIFNPWLQQKKFDPDTTYIKRYIPELTDLTSQAIHSLDTRRPDGIAYPSPIVDHAHERDVAITRFKKA